MERIDDTSDLITMAAADAMASTMAGGQAWPTWLDDWPLCTRSPSCHRVMAYWRGLLSAAERNNRWQVADICGASP